MDVVNAEQAKIAEQAGVRNELMYSIDLKQQNSSKTVVAHR